MAARRTTVAALLASACLVVACSAEGDTVGETSRSTSSRAESDVDGPDGPGLSDHWHVAYAFEVCGEVLPASTDRGADTYGIHTHDDGLVHVHPFLAGATDGAADLGVFLDQIGATVSGDSIEVNGERHDTEEGCGDNRDAVVRVAQWDESVAAAEGADPDRVVMDDFGSIHLAPDLSALTISLGPRGAPISPPPSAADICTLAAVDGVAVNQGCPTPSVPEEEDAESVAGQPCVAAEHAPEGVPDVAVPVGPPPDDLVVEDLVVGDGEEAEAGDELVVDYVGVACSTGEVFDSSFEQGEPFDLTLGTGMVIAGWDEGLLGLAVGGRRQLVIPPALAYGDSGSAPDVAPGETLVFVVDLRSIEGTTTDTTAPR